MGLRHVAVKGDAEKRHQAKRDAMDTLVKVGDMVAWMGTKDLKVLKVNKKTFTLQGAFGKFTADKGHCDPIHQ